MMPYIYLIIALQVLQIAAIFLLMSASGTTSIRLKETNRILNRIIINEARQQRQERQAPDNENAMRGQHPELWQWEPESAEEEDTQNKAW